MLRKCSYWVCPSQVILRPVLGTPHHCTFCMSPSLDTLNSSLVISTNTLMSGVICVRWGRRTKCAVVGDSQDGFGKHWKMICKVPEYIKNVTAFIQYRYLPCTSFPHHRVVWRSSSSVVCMTYNILLVYTATYGP